MQTLRKKTSPFKYKHESSRFGGEGQCFKAKLIGILEVSEARGDRMCQEALSDLKMAIRAAGEHKQRITVHIALDGLRLRDEKTGDCLYHHPVHKISFIAQDMTDSRAFGYIFGSPDTGHRFFGIKTDKAASQVVIAMRDLFQVVFALKKKEIELAKQHLEKNCLYNSPLFSDSSSNKSITPELPAKYEAIKNESKSTTSTADTRMSGTAVANLVDLQLELNSLQQGLHQMEKITPSDTYGSKDDPFGDSFTSFPNPILPPPPSSGKERSSRNSESSSIFSPKTPHTADSLTTTSGVDSYPFTSLPKTDFKLSRDLSSSHEEPSSGEWFTPSNSLFEESSSLVPETAQKSAKDEQLEQTKKDILSQFDVFTELDPLGTGRSKPYIDKKHFFQELKNPPKKVLNDLVTQNQNQSQNETKDLGGKIVATSMNSKNSMSGFDSDPFGEDPFVSLDPFAETEFKQDPFEKDFMDYKKTTNKNEQINLLSRPLSKSPNTLNLNSISSLSTSPKNVKFNDSLGELEKKMEDDALGVGSAPEPPPRPESTILQIKPPPLPPKKQTNDILIKPPPRPPHNEDPMYDYMRSYETGSKSLDSYKDVEESPALPIPMRKTKFESDFVTAPERPAKQFVAHSFEDDYLTPIQVFKSNEFEGRILLPPPSANTSKSSTNENSGGSTINTQVNGTNNSGDSSNNTLEGLDITLSQLTLSSLNELAVKLNIPSSQLSNMTLVQLTEYLSNVIKSKSQSADGAVDRASENNATADFPAFKADFESNFGHSNVQVIDRYAVFRELINEEIKQTKITTEPEELQENEKEQYLSSSINASTTQKLLSIDSTIEDRYAALREIVENDLLRTEQNIKDENKEKSILQNLREESLVESNGGTINEREEETVPMKNDSNKDEIITNEKSNIDYNKEIEGNDKDIGSLKSPKSPIKIALKSPVPSAITEIIQNNVRLNSGSLSDIVSGSSPEIDNTISNFEAGLKISDTTGESWAIFDHSSNPQESLNEKQGVQSEEGLSPWSSDSKDGNGSQSDYYRRGDSESGGDRWNRKTERREQEGWWDTSAEPEVPYNSSKRRSTDSYDEEFYECHDRPRRRRPGARGSQGGSQAGGGHSSSSRDVSPWEEEPKRRDGRSDRIGWSRSSKQQFDRHHERRPTDSWDDEDDYEYNDPRRFHWGSGSRESDRHSAASRDDLEPRERWNEEWSDDRRRRRRRDTDRDHWCCPDWEEVEHDKPPSRYGRWSNVGTPPGKWRDRKYEDRYYNREESPWEDEYPIDQEDIHPSHYAGSRRNWKRPNSASEMERKVDFKGRHIGGSDGERDRRYKGTRRSRSRDSQYSEPPYRHKPDTNSLTRSSYKGKSHSQYIKSEFQDLPNKKQLDANQLDIAAKKTFTLQNRKKKESPNNEENMNTFPRKSSKAKQSFENDFQPEIRNTKCEFENNFQIEPEFPVTIKSAKLKQQHSMIELQRKPSRDSKPRSYQARSKSLFEDDFATNKIEHIIEDKTISVIKEEIDVGEENDCFRVTNIEHATNSNRLSKRLSGGLRTDLKKSESVNIFSRENDPFDDDFFCENEGDVHIFDNTSDKKDLRNSDNRWTDNFNT